jgi:hypothetical protein
MNCANMVAPQPTWPIQRTTQVSQVQFSRFNWMRRGRNGVGDILLIQTVRLAVPDCPTCKKHEALTNHCTLRMWILEADCDG